MASKMAKKYKTKKTIDSYEFSYKKDFESDWSVHKNYIKTFDAYEAMFQGLVYDSVSKSIDNASITDSYAMTLAKERADRVIAKLPEGETESVGKADVGKAMFMDILRQKWLFPNANAQHPFMEKLNMWQLYSSVYGYMPMFYDWNVSPTGYVGPDCWLWNPRNLVPQQGKTSLADMEYMTALTWVSKRFLENIMENEEENDGWNRTAIRLLLEKVDSEADLDTDHDTLTERERIGTPTKRGVLLATRYEAGEDGNWCTFAPDNSMVQIREIPNPHKNGRIPFVIKYSQPMFDSFYGIGDFQRAKPLQFARDGLTNFYFEGIKMNLVPPIVANANGSLKHTLDYRPGGVLLETIPNSIRRLETSTGGLSTYQAAMSALTGQLLGQFGSQNASLPGAEALNPSQGRTPAAIDLYSDKEATRDGAERRHLEAAIEDLTDAFFSLIVNMGTEDIPVQLFSEDIIEIQKAGHEDIMEMFMPDSTGTAADLVINPEALQGVEYRFNITPNSTAKINKEKQLAELERFMGNIGKLQNLFADDPRYQLHPEKISAALGELADIKGADEFISVNEGPTPAEQQLAAENQQLQAQLQEKDQQMMSHQKQMEGMQMGMQKGLQMGQGMGQEPPQSGTMNPGMGQPDPVEQAKQVIANL